MNIGTQVVLKKKKKLDSVYRGPFVITEIISPQNVEIKMKNNTF